MDPETLFTKAADLLREAGWGQHAYRPKGGGLCVLGALNVTLGFTYDDGDALYEFPWLDELRDRQLELSRWNDDEGRTKEEVLEALGRLAVGCTLDDILPPAHADT